MKALVLSGGSGTRLRPFSHSMPKQLIPVANKPVLEHVLANIRDLGVTDVGVIVGDRAADVSRALGDGTRSGVRITYLRQESPLGLAHCVRLAREFLGDDDFVMYLGDNMLPAGIGQVAAEFTEHRPAAHVVVHKVADPSAFGVVELDSAGRVEHLVEKPRNPHSDLALIGVYFFTPAIHEAVAAIAPSSRGELEITDAVQWLVDQGAPVRATQYSGYWKDVGRVEDVLECNRVLLEGVESRVSGEVDDASVIKGPVVIEEGARVVRSLVEGPTIIGPRSVVEDSTVGPYTTLGAGCVVRGTRLDASIALDGAVITGVRRLSGSLVGREARVALGAQGPAEHRLVVGDHCRIEVTG
ncbi:glucose-1-phosphate thymidylyltransferase [Streptomyces hayashii]|uniref:glucose-1-phosphate thymidylyltransferase n=1 Tax=Streptomyces hayashii TaxID=2839966 RepID=UPI00403C2A11